MLTNCSLVLKTAETDPSRPRPQVSRPRPQNSGLETIPTSSSLETKTAVSKTSSLFQGR